MKLKNYNLELTEVETLAIINSLHYYLTNDLALEHYPDAKKMIECESISLSVLYNLCSIANKRVIYENVISNISRHHFKEPDLDVD